MAHNMTFRELHRTDNRFKAAVEDLVLGVSIMALGLDPEQIMDAWNPQKGILDIGMVGLGNVVELTRVVDGQDVFTEAEFTSVANVVADLEGKAAKEKVEELAGDGEDTFLAAIRDQDPRSSVAMQAARALFDLRHAE